MKNYRRDLALCNMESILTPEFVQLINIERDKMKLDRLTLVGRIQNKVPQECKISGNYDCPHLYQIHNTSFCTDEKLIKKFLESNGLDVGEYTRNKK